MHLEKRQLQDCGSGGPGVKDDIPRVIWDADRWTIALFFKFGPSPTENVLVHTHLFICLCWLTLT